MTIFSSRRHFSMAALAIPQHTDRIQYLSGSVPWVIEAYCSTGELPFNLWTTFWPATSEFCCFRLCPWMSRQMWSTRAQFGAAEWQIPNGKVSHTHSGEVIPRAQRSPVWKPLFYRNKSDNPTYCMHAHVLRNYNWLQCPLLRTDVYRQHVANMYELRSLFTYD